jgi:Cu/Ag efflux pump CusA
MPAVIGRQGVLSTIAVPLDGEEREALELSAQKIREVIESISSIESMKATYLVIMELRFTMVNRDDASRTWDTEI